MLLRPVVVARAGSGRGVRVRRDDHAAGPPDVVRPVVVGEAPGPDQRAEALGERPAHRHRPRAAQGDEPRLEELDLGDLWLLLGWIALFSFVLSPVTYKTLDGGRAWLDTPLLGLNFPTVYPAPLRLEAARGRVDWYFSPEEVSGQGRRVLGERQQR